MAMGTRERVDTLENALKELAYAGRRTEMNIDRISHELRQEMADFKSEMSDFKSEMSDFKSEMSDFKSKVAVFMSGMEDFKVEMSDFKREMAAYKEENRREARRMNEQWGALANKWGTFTEDVVIPNFPRILERYFGITKEQVEAVLPRAHRRHPTDKSRSKEFDLIAWTADIVFWNETKATAPMSFLAAFIKDATSVFEFFPELAGKRLVKIASALSLTDREIAYLTRNRCYAMALGDETMDLLNFEQLGGKL